MQENDNIRALYAPNHDAPPNLLKVVANMKRLRLLNVRQQANVVEEPLSLSDELRWISWENYPAISLPTRFCPRMLSGLILRNGLQRVLWQQGAPLVILTYAIGGFWLSIINNFVRNFYIENTFYRF